jgi:putative Holliday junction resolvase
MPEQGPAKQTVYTALGFDYGTRKIGAAYGQSLTGTAQPLELLPAKEGIPNWQQIERLIEEWQPTLLVVGLPLNMDGSESALSTRARKFANRLHGRFGLNIELVDERLTTRAAREELQDSSGNVDSHCAAIILRDWFNQLADGKCKPDRPS